MKKEVSMSYQAAALLKHTVCYTGEMITGENGKELEAKRRLNGKESSQRRHFTKQFEVYKKQFDEETQEKIKEYHELIKTTKEAIKKQFPQGADEPDEVYKERVKIKLNNKEEIETAIQELNEFSSGIPKRECRFEFTNTTLEFLKNYFEAFSEEAGFLEGDDESAEELAVVLK